MKNHSHFILFKSYGYLSQFKNNQSKRTNKKMLGELFDFPEKTMAIGRLDEPSEGLLLLTTDGKVSEYVRSSQIEKEYYVQLDGIITPQAIELLKNGIEITTENGKYITKKCKVSKITSPQLPERAKRIRDERHGPTSWISVVLTEGKFRQIRKMTAAVGFPTLRLVRYRIGQITIAQMKPNEVIEVPDLIQLI